MCIRDSLGRSFLNYLSCFSQMYSSAPSALRGPGLPLQVPRSAFASLKATRSLDISYVFVVNEVNNSSPGPKMDQQCTIRVLREDGRTTRGHQVPIYDALFGPFWPFVALFGPLLAPLGRLLGVFCALLTSLGAFFHFCTHLGTFLHILVPFCPPRDQPDPRNMWFWLTK